LKNVLLYLVLFTNRLPYTNVFLGEKKPKEGKKKKKKKTVLFNIIAGNYTGTNNNKSYDKHNHGHSTL